jgi:hypothetical protein
MTSKRSRFPKALPEYELHKAIYDMPSETYHSIQGTYSSTQFKDLLDDEEIFIKKYVTKTIERVSIPAFDVGTYFHSGVLEPHKIKDECVVFTGKIRKGKEWDAFKSKNSGKVILTQGQEREAKGLVESVKNSPVAMGYVQSAQPEVSFFAELVIFEGVIYAPYYNVAMNKYGWEEATLSKDQIKKGVSIVVKVRADALGEDYVQDLKSTTGNARSEFSMRQKISHYQYDLSASLYLDMFSLHAGDQLTKFIWTFASKDFFNCKSYMASPTNILVGRAKYMKALTKLASLMTNKWQLWDSIGVLEPMNYELEYIKEKELDL